MNKNLQMSIAEYYNFYFKIDDDFALCANWNERAYLVYDKKPELKTPLVDLKEKFIHEAKQRLMESN